MEEIKNEQSRYEQAWSLYDKNKHEEAFKMFCQLAEEGDAESLYTVGLMYHTGDCVEKNMEKAVEYYQKSAELNHAGAQYFLGLCYFNGD